MSFVTLTVLTAVVSNGKLIGFSPAVFMGVGMLLISSYSEATKNLDGEQMGCFNAAFGAVLSGVGLALNIMALGFQMKGVELLGIILGSHGAAIDFYGVDKVAGL